jgi:hypothetical protein
MSGNAGAPLSTVGAQFPFVTPGGVLQSWALQFLQRLASGAGGTVQSFRTVFSSAQILAAKGGPVTVVAAPAAGNAIVVLQVVYEVAYRGVAYSGGPAALYYGSLAGPAAAAGDGSIFGAAASSILVVAGGVGLGRLANSAVAAQPIVWGIPSGGSAYSGGNGTGAVTVLYTTVTL